MVSIISSLFTRAPQYNEAVASQLRDALNEYFDSCNAYFAKPDRAYQTLLGKVSKLEQLDTPIMKEIIARHEAKRILNEEPERKSELQTAFGIHHNDHIETLVTQSLLASKTDMVATTARALSNVSKGLPNLGNTCYLNATLKAFFVDQTLYTPLLSKTLYRFANESKQTFSSRVALQNNLRKLSEAFQKPNFDSRAVWEICEKIAFSPILRERGLQVRVQGDPHELLAVILQALEEDSSSLGLQHGSKLVATADSRVSSIKVDGRSSIIELHDCSANSVTAAFKELSQAEIVDGVELNGTRRQAFKKQFFIADQALPKHLTVRLPRYDAAMNRNSKAYQDILQDQTLPVCYSTGTKREDITLRPKAFVCHVGSYLGEGHYITIKKTARGFEEHNDEVVRRLTKQEALRMLLNSAYLVQYEVIS